MKSLIKFNILLITFAGLLLWGMLWYLDCDRVCVGEKNSLAALLIKCQK